MTARTDLGRMNNTKLDAELDTVAGESCGLWAHMSALRKKRVSADSRLEQEEIK